MTHIPVAVGMVHCDHVIVEEGTHNITPVNCFNVRLLDDLPGSATFFALSWLANGKGDMSAEIVVERLDTLEQIYRDQRNLVFSDRLHDARFVARIRNSIFSVAGYYELSLIMDREIIAHRRFRVKRKAAPNDK